MDKSINKNAAEADFDGNEQTQPESSATTTTTITTTTPPLKIIGNDNETEDGIASEPLAPAKVLSPEETRTSFQTFMIMASLCAVCLPSLPCLTIISILTLKQGPLPSCTRCHHCHHSSSHNCSTFPFKRRLYLDWFGLSSH